MAQLLRIGAAHQAVFEVPVCLHLARRFRRRSLHLLSAQRELRVLAFDERQVAREFVSRLARHLRCRVQRFCVRVRSALRMQRRHEERTRSAEQEERPEAEEENAGAHRWVPAGGRRRDARSRNGSGEFAAAVAELTCSARTRRIMSGRVGAEGRAGSASLSSGLRAIEEADGRRRREERATR